MKHKMRLKLSLLFAVLACMSCSAGSSTAPDDFLPVFTYVWQNTEDPNHSLSLISADDFQRSGLITGTEERNFDESSLDGTFEGVRVTRMTIHRATGDVVYTGRLVLPTSLVLTSGRDTITLSRPRQ